LRNPGGCRFDWGLDGVCAEVCLECADYGKAIELDPKFAPAYNALAYAKKGDPDRAIADFDNAIELDPKYTVAYFDRGIAYGNKGDLGTSSGAIGETVDFTNLLEIARGVPRSFPFHNVVLIFSVPAFSGRVTLNSTIHGGQLPGITVTDSWWVNARQRSLTALTIVEAEPTAKKLPAPPASLTAAFAACGKVKKTVQVPLVIGTSSRPTLDTASSEVAQAIRAVVHDYRTRMAEIIDRAQLPNDLPPNPEVAATEPVGVTVGPRKSELVRAFAPMGYDCRGESGTFTLRRRRSGNLTAELLLDVGTWCHSVAAIFRLQGLVNDIGFKATLILPVARRAVVGGQYPVGGPEQRRQIVDNLAALVAELDRSFVPAIEVASGPSPDWYRPESSTNERD
jgi:TPR repeat